LKSIVNRIRPAVEGLTDISQAVRANVRASANQLRHGSEVLEHLVMTNGLLVVGAEYSLETGIVDFFDGLPDGN
jgi:carbonic anhydrase